MNPIILWGATGQARVLAEFLPKLGFELRALFDNNPQASSPIPGVTIHHGKEGFLRWREANQSPTAGLAAIGGEHGDDRLAVQEFLASHGIEIVTAIHPFAFVADDVVLGAGSQVLALAVVAAGARIGRGCIVNHHGNVDHECVLADGVHIAPAATLCGLVTVGESTLIGAGATVLPRIHIGARSMVGAGAVVTRNLPDNVIAAGNPARILRALGHRPTAA